MRTFNRSGPWGGIDINVAASDQPVDAAVWIVIYDPVHETKVRRG